MNRLRVALAGVVAVVAVVAAPRVARAMPDGGGWLHYELTGLHALEDAPASKANELVLAGVRLHGFIGTARVGYHLGIDLAAGSTLRRAGLAYDVALFPIGMALRLGGAGVVTLGAGVGASGAVGALDDATTFPIEANLELGGGRMRLLARARAIYLAGSDPRQGGSPTFTFTDEIDATLGIRIGDEEDRYGFRSGNGYFAGVAYRELAGGQFVGLVIGYSIDGATAPQRSRDASSRCEYCD